MKQAVKIHQPQLPKKAKHPFPKFILLLIGNLDTSLKTSAEIHQVFGADRKFKIEEGQATLKPPISIKYREKTEDFFIKFNCKVVNDYNVRQYPPKNK